MATLRTLSPSALRTQPARRTVQQAGIIDRYLAFADAQKPYHTAWYLGSMLAHSCFLVPLTFLLLYSSGSLLVLPFLAISMAFFFLNIVANMSGMSTRSTIFLFGLSVLLHVFMVASTLLTM